MGGVMAVELVVTPSALACFKKEWGFKNGESYRVFVRYVSGAEVPFAFGIMRDAPLDAAATVSEEGLTFFLESKDVWFLEGKSLFIDCLGEEIVYAMA